jgi:hypothetical protein
VKKVAAARRCQLVWVGWIFPPQRPAATPECLSHNVSIFGTKSQPVNHPGMLLRELTEILGPNSVDDYCHTDLKFGKPAVFIIPKQFWRESDPIQRLQL